MKVDRIHLANNKSRVYFGEIDGDAYYEPSNYSRNGYELKKKQINDRFDLRRDSLCQINDSDPDVFWNEFHKIEALRKRALDELDNNCRKCLSKKWNPLRLLGLIK